MSAVKLNLNQLKEGMKAKIISIDTNNRDRERFYALGLKPGKEIELFHVSPFNDPKIFKMGENKILIRNSEASRIMVESKDNLIDLFSAPKGFYQVYRLNGGNFFTRKMSQKDINEGTKIHKETHNSFLLIEKNKTIFLGKGELNKILVSPIEKEEK
jgi:ferrous iron transport protein A